MKQKILDNVSEYSASQLVEYIRKGVVTFEELVQDSEGEFSVEKRKEVKQLLESGDADEWNKVKKLRTVESIQYYLDSYPEGQFRSEARALKKELEEEEQKSLQQKATDNVWTLLDKSSIEALRAFVKQYPNSTHVNEARRLIDALLLDEIMGYNIDTLVEQINQVAVDKRFISGKQQDDKIISLIEQYIEGGKIKKSDLLDKIKEDYNFLSSGIVKRLISSGILLIDDLKSIGIDTLFIQKMFKGESAQIFDTPERLDRIHKQSTEVYFWGIPSSGKSCALGAILSVVASGKSGDVEYSMNPDTESQGHGYMTKISNLFRAGQVGTLMEGTSVDSFYEMGFDLIDKSSGKIYPMTFIDMAGELMRCMYKANARIEMSETEEVMLDTLTRVLIDNRTINRKMHIFVIEYGAEERLYEGLPQRVYLEGVVSYIRNMGIFKKDTDAIYIMISKSDKAKNATPDTFNEYIQREYLGFYNMLEQICKDNEINKGKVEKIAFSLGEVCFQNYCKFNSLPAENVVNVLLKRSASFRGGKRGMFEKIFRS